MTALGHEFDLRDAAAGDGHAPRWGKLIDQSCCVGCSVCKSENDVPLSVTRTCTLPAQAPGKALAWLAGEAACAAARPGAPWGRRSVIDVLEGRAAAAAQPSWLAEATQTQEVSHD